MLLNMPIPAHPLDKCLIKNSLKKKVSNIFFQQQHLLQIKITPGFQKQLTLCQRSYRILMLKKCGAIPFFFQILLFANSISYINNDIESSAEVFIFREVWKMYKW